MSRNILFVGTVFPEPVSSAAGVRTESLLEDFRSRGDRILFTSPSDQNQFSGALRERGIETHQIGPNDPTFDSIVREFRPDIAIFDRFNLEEQFAWRVAEQAPGAIRVLDTIDLHFVRRWRGEKLKRFLHTPNGYAEGASISDGNLQSLFFADVEETDDCLREVAAIFRSDLTLILSSFELDLLKERFQVPASLLLELGFSYPTPDREKRRDFSERKNFVSIGNFRHLPNRDSAFWMARALWPKMREQLAALGDRETELHLYGAYPPKEIMALDDPKGRFRVFGPAENAIETLCGYRALLAPLRFGAGIKGKITDAWSAGIPVVTTPIGAEGMVVRALDFAGKVARSEDEFVDAAVAVLASEADQRKLISAGDQSLENLYSPETNRRALFEKLDSLADGEALRLARESNRVGRILRSELHARTKYFSKWIEAKNTPQTARVE